MSVYRLLPRNNCGECGFTTCVGFAAALRTGKTELSCCAVLKLPEYEEKRAGLLRFLAR